MIGLRPGEQVVYQGEPSEPPARARSSTRPAKAGRSDNTKAGHASYTCSDHNARDILIGRDLLARDARDWFLAQLEPTADHADRAHSMRAVAADRLDRFVPARGMTLEQWCRTRPRRYPRSMMVQRRLDGRPAGLVGPDSAVEACEAARLRLLTDYGVDLWGGRTAQATESALDELIRRAHRPKRCPRTGDAIEDDAARLRDLIEQRSAKQWTRDERDTLRGATKAERAWYAQHRDQLTAAERGDPEPPPPIPS